MRDILGSSGVIALEQGPILPCEDDAGLCLIKDQDKCTGCETNFNMPIHPRLANSITLKFL